jgi:hypothetical protein
MKTTVHASNDPKARFVLASPRKEVEVTVGVAKQDQRDDAIGSARVSIHVNGEEKDAVTLWLTGKKVDEEVRETLRFRPFERAQWKPVLAEVRFAIPDAGKQPEPVIITILPRWPTLASLAALGLSLVVGVVRLEWLVQHHVYYKPVAAVGAAMSLVFGGLGARLSGLKVWTWSTWRPTPRPGLLMTLAPIPLFLGLAIPPYALAIRNGTEMTVRIAEADIKPGGVAIWWPSANSVAALAAHVPDYGVRFCALDPDGGRIDDAGPCQDIAKGAMELPLFGRPGETVTVSCRERVLPIGLRLEKKASKTPETVPLASGTCDPDPTTLLRADLGTVLADPSLEGWLALKWKDLDAHEAATVVSLSVPKRVRLVQHGVSLGELRIGETGDEGVPPRKCSFGETCPRILAVPSGPVTLESPGAWKLRASLEGEDIHAIEAPGIFRFDVTDGSTWTSGSSDDGVIVFCGHPAIVTASCRVGTSFSVPRAFAPRAIRSPGGQTATCPTAARQTYLFSYDSSASSWRCQSDVQPPLKGCYFIEGRTRLTATSPCNPPLSRRALTVNEEALAKDMGCNPGLPAWCLQ